MWIKSVASPFPGIIAIGVLCGGCEPSILGKRKPYRGLGMVPFERALVSSYRPYIETFPLSFCVSEILLLLCTNMPLFPTPPLVSPKFPHVLLGVGGWPLGYEERRCWANCDDPPTLQTDGWTDDMWSQDCALHYSASRGKSRTISAECHFLSGWNKNVKTWAWGIFVLV